MDAWDRKLSARRRRQELRTRAVAFLGGRCTICGYDRCAAGFDFHHVEIWIKDFTISQKMTSWEVIEPELKKCVLLCARCHREVHDGLHPGYLVDESHNRQGDRFGWDEFDLEGSTGG